MLAATDDLGNDVFIEDAIPGKDYHCPCCKGIVRCRAKESNKVREHFYHLDCTNCDGGESALHKYWKHHLINIGETINLPLVGELTCLDKWIEYSSKDNKYRPDIIIKTNNSKYRFIIFEILNTNKKDKERYNKIWENYNYPVYEIDVRYLHRDKYNFSSCLRLLYHPEKKNFEVNTKQLIKQLQDILKDGIYGGHISYEAFCTFVEGINKIESILKPGLNKPIRIDLDLLDMKLKRIRVNKYYYKKLTLPLTDIVNQLKLYK